MIVEQMENLSRVIGKKSTNEHCETDIYSI